MTNETNPGTVEVTPCPFCGGDELGHGYEMAGSYFAGNVQCYTCNAYIVADSEADAIAAWNTRAAQSQPAATVQEVGREAQQKTVAQAVANIVGAPYDDWRHFTNEADAILARLAALTAEPAAKAGDAGVQGEDGDFMEKMVAKRRYLLLASYCGGEANCSDTRPCDDCLAMCNVFKVDDANPTYERELGPAPVAPPSPQPDMGSGEGIAAAIEFERMHPSLELCVQFSDDGQHIRRWSRLPFEGGTDFYSHPSADYSAGKVQRFADALAAGDFANVSSALNQAMCCNGHMCGCQGSTVGEYLAHELHAALSTLPHKEEATPAPVGEQGDNCERCQGNGEIVTDWDRYLHGHEGDKGDEAVAECPDCNGTGHVDLPPAGEQGAEEWGGPLTAEEQAKIDAAWEKHKAADPVCRIPPEGWSCSRVAGHEGPCAATPATTERGRG